MIAIRLLCLATAMLATPALAERLTDQQFQDISENVFRPVIEEYDIPGIAIGVTLDGEHYFFADGLADRETSRPVDGDTLFELGSNSKLFNVALAALAQNRGLLSMHDPVARHMPELQGGAFDRISLYDLAAHATGGLPLQVPKETADMPALIAYLANWRPDVETKSVRSYSNVSIGLLGTITAKQFGTSYQDAITEKLLPGLGLTNTFITVPGTAMNRYAFGYSRSDDTPTRVSPGLLDAEAYGVKSTAADMIRFLDAHLGNLSLAPEIAAALAETRVSEYDTAHYAQAMIWEGYEWPVEASELVAGNSAEMGSTVQPMSHRAKKPLEGSVFLNKTGGTNGFGSYVAMIPSERIGVVVLANRNYPNPVRAATTLELIEKILAQTNG